MNRNEPSTPQDHLLKHSRWVNKLAVSLAGKGDADDLAQEV